MKYVKFGISIVFVSIIFLFMKQNAWADCSSFYNPSVTHLNGVMTYNIASTSWGCGYHLDEISATFVTDHTGVYKLEYSADNGLTWHSQYQGATNSAQQLLNAGTLGSPGDARTLTSTIDPSIILKINSGLYPFDQTNLQLRVVSLDSTTWSSSNESFTPLQTLDDAAVPLGGSTLSAGNPIKTCDSLDIACNVTNGFVNTLAFFFGFPSSIPAVDSLKTQVNSKVPFAYINSALNFDTTYTASSDALPDFVLPGTSGTVLGTSITLPTTTYHFPSNVTDALHSMKPYLRIGLGMLLIMYFLQLARAVI